MTIKWNFQVSNFKLFAIISSIVWYGDKLLYQISLLSFFCLWNYTGKTFLSSRFFVNFINFIQFSVNYTMIISYIVPWIKQRNFPFFHRENWDKTRKWINLRFSLVLKKITEFSLVIAGSLRATWHNGIILSG